jgi:demethylspheroidene O-methyltransferase
VSLSAVLKGWQEPFLRWRDRVLANPETQFLMARVPVLRSVARAKAGRAFDLVAGFVHSQVLSAWVSLGLPQRLRAGPLAQQSLREGTGLGADGFDRLVRACVALDLMSVRAGGRLGLGETGAALLANPGVFAMVAHHERLYRDLTDPVALLRERRHDTALAAEWAYAGAQAPGEAARDAVASYSALMAQTQDFIAREALGAYPFARHRHLMDVGGGVGAFLSAVGRRHGGLDLTLFDLPAVVELAGPALETSLPGRNVRRLGGDFHRDTLPEGADLISLVRVLHDHDDAPVQALLRRVAQALPVGGRVLIVEPMADTPGARAMGDSYFGLYLWAMGSGRPRTRGELSAMLREAGFEGVREHPTRQPVLARVLSARRRARG